MMATTTASTAGTSQSFDRLLCRLCTSSVMVLYGNWLGRGEFSSEPSAPDLSHQVQGSLPAGFGEEMESDVAHPRDVAGHARLLVLMLRGVERPVIEEWTSHDVFAGHKSPVT